MAGEPKRDGAGPVAFTTARRDPVRLAASGARYPTDQRDRQAHPCPSDRRRATVGALGEDLPVGTAQNRVWPW
jgi:hypothetical protein